MELFNLTAKIILNAKDVESKITRINTKVETLTKNFNALDKPASKVGKALGKIQITDAQVSNMTEMAKAVRLLAAAYRDLGGAQGSVSKITAPSSASVKATLRQASKLTSVEPAVRREKAKQQRVEQAAQAKADKAKFTGASLGKSPPASPSKPPAFMQRAAKTFGLDKATREAKALEGGLGRVNKKLDTSRKSTGALGNLMGRVSSILTSMAIYGSFQAFTNGIREAVTVSSEFQASLRELNGLAGVSEKKLGELGERYRTSTERLGVGVDPNQLVQGTRSLLAAGYSNVDDASTVADQGILLAKATSTKDQTKSIELLGSLMTAYGASADQAAYYTELIINSTDQGLVTLDGLYTSIGRAAPFAAAAGVSVEELLAIIGTATSKSIRTETAVTGIGQAISKLVSPSKAGQQVLKDLGVTVDTATIKSKGLVAVLKEIKDAVGDDVGKLKTIIGTQRGTNVVSSIFDPDGGTSLINANVKNVSKPGAKDQRLDSIMQSAQEQWGVVVGNIKSAFIWLGTELDGTFAEFFKSLGQFKPEFNALFIAMKEMITMSVGWLTEDSSSKIREGLNFITLSIIDMGHIIAAGAITLKWAFDQINRQLDTALNTGVIGDLREKASTAAKGNSESKVKAFEKGKSMARDQEIAASTNMWKAKDARIARGETTPSKGELLYAKQMQESFEAGKVLEEKINKEKEIILENEKIIARIKQAQAASEVPEIWPQLKDLAGKMGTLKDSVLSEKQKGPLTPVDPAQVAKQARIDATHKKKMSTDPKYRAHYEKKAADKEESDAKEYERLLLKQAKDPNNKDIKERLSKTKGAYDRKYQAIRNAEDETDQPAGPKATPVDVKEKIASIKHEVKLGRTSYEEAIAAAEKLLQISIAQGESAKERRAIESDIVKLTARKDKVALAQSKVDHKLAEGGQSPVQVALSKLEVQKEKLIAEGADPESAEMWHYKEMAQTKEEFRKKDEDAARKTKVLSLKNQSEIAEAEGRTLDAKILMLDAEFAAFEKTEKNKVDLARAYTAKRAKIEKDHLDTVEAQRIHFNSRTVANEVAVLREKGKDKQANEAEMQQAADERVQAAKEHIQSIRDSDLSEGEKQIAIARYIESEKSRIAMEARQSRQQSAQQDNITSGYTADPTDPSNQSAGFSGISFSGIGSAVSKVRQSDAVDPAATRFAIQSIEKLEDMKIGSSTTLPDDHPAIRKTEEKKTPAVEVTNTLIIREETPDGKVILKSGQKPGTGKRDGGKGTYELGRTKGL